MLSADALHTLDVLADLAVTHVFQVTTLMVVVALVNQLLSSRAPRLAAGLWVLVAVKALTPPVLASRVGLFGWLPLGSLPVGDAAALQVADIAPNTAWLRWACLAAIAAWAVGVVTLAARQAAGHWALGRLLSRDTLPTGHALVDFIGRLADSYGLSRPRRVVVSQDEIGPAVSGVLAPTLILPASLVTHADGSWDRLRAVVLHELVHTSRRDAAHAWLMSVWRIVWWFHPMVWWSADRANHLVERCVDLTVTRDLRTGLPEYARGLVSVLELRAELCPTPQLAGLRPCQITNERLTYLRGLSRQGRLETPRRHGRGGAIGRWGLLIALAALTLPSLPNDLMRPGCLPPADRTSALQADVTVR